MHMSYIPSSNPEHPLKRLRWNVTQPAQLLGLLEHVLLKGPDRGALGGGAVLQQGERREGGKKELT